MRWKRVAASLLAAIALSSFVVDTPPARATTTVVETPAQPAAVPAAPSTLLGNCTSSTPAATSEVTSAVSSVVSEAGTADALVGFFETCGDYAHKSGGDMSAHGWWIDHSTGIARARVTVWIQQHWGDWVTIGRGQGDIRPGGGSQKVTARGVCTEYPGHGYHWRSVIDVDLIGTADTPERLYTPERRTDCSARGIGPA